MEPDSDKVVAIECMPALDRLWRCATPTNQFNEVYRHGKFETCGKSVSELFTCFHAKFVVSREPERAQKMMDDAIRANRKVATSAPPWELKAQGSWDSAA